MDENSTPVTLPPPNLIDALPGQRMHVSEVTERLSSMWQTGDAEQGGLPQDFRASQLNLVLHLGLRTSAQEARACFDTAINFAQTKPCRIIVLCPMGREPSDRLLEAKLFAQCFVGNGLRQMCCCEALILGYPTRESGFLTNQIANWLEGDLPIYHWFNRIAAARIGSVHSGFLQLVRRVLVDSAIEGEGFISDVDWPHPSRVRDLAYARLLPVRQALGQFLSAYCASTLVSGLKRIQLGHAPTMAAEAASLKAWAMARLEACAKAAEQTLEAQVELKASPEACLSLKLEYAGAKHLHWHLRQDQEASVIEGELAGQRFSQPLPAHCLSPEAALSEAIFFG
jgi:hypothetical protein